MKMVCLLIFCLNKILLCELLFPTTKLFGSNEDFFFFLDETGFIAKPVLKCS